MTRPAGELRVSGQELEPATRPAPTGREAADALLGVARVAAGMWLRTAAWSVGVTVRLARTAGDPQAADQLLNEIGEGLRAYAREFLGVTELDERIRQAMPAPPRRRGAGANGVAEVEALRVRGAELLRQSADVSVDETSHPAYARILEELAGDEARILRLLYSEGSQAAVDVRSSQLMGLGSQLLAEGLNMVGPQAGARHPERVAAYLNNLNRLGLVWFSKEPLDDPIAYQVLEAQPAVLGALKRSPRAKTVQRSLRLTPFGLDFVEACLPIRAVETGEVIDTPEPRDTP